VLCGRHLAGVLAADCAPSAGLLATGGEDGLVRLWDVRARQPTIVISPIAGLPGKAGSGAYPGNTTPTTLLSAVRTAPPVMCLKLSSSGGSGGGGWLHIGCAPSPAALIQQALASTSPPSSQKQQAPVLATWSVDAGMLAARTLLPPQCTPQVLGVVPGQVLLAGTGNCLYR
jgi:hypothetical protein